MLRFLWQGKKVHQSRGLRRLSSQGRSASADTPYECRLLRGPAHLHSQQIVSGLFMALHAADGAATPCMAGLLAWEKAPGTCWPQAPPCRAIQQCDMAFTPHQRKFQQGDLLSWLHICTARAMSELLRLVTVLMGAFRPSICIFRKIPQTAEQSKVVTCGLAGSN